MKSRTNLLSNPARQNGTVLVMALVFLVILTLLGVGALNTTSLQEKMAGNTQDRNYAFQAAESGIRAGENIIGQARQPTDVKADPSITTDGLHLASTTSQPIWETPGLWSSSDVITISGAFTKLSSAPKFIIEYVGKIDPPGDSLGVGSRSARKGIALFRVTSRATGGTDAAVSMVQSTYQKPF